MKLVGQSQVPSDEVLSLLNDYSAPVWKVLGAALNNRSFLHGLRDRGVAILGRLYLPDVDGTWKDGMLGDFLQKVKGNPIGMADWYWNQIRAHLNFDLVDYWESPNEPFGEMHTSDHLLVPSYDQFMAQLVRRGIRENKPAVVGNMGSGAWNYLDFSALFSRTAMLNPIWGQHEYGWPHILDQAPRHAMAHQKITWSNKIWVTEAAVTKAVDGQGPDVGFKADGLDRPLVDFSTMLQDYERAATAEYGFLFLTGAAQDWVERGFEATDVLRMVYGGTRKKGRPRQAAGVKELKRRKVYQRDGK